MEIFDQIRREIGERLRVERERLKMTQAELASALGVNRYSIFKYESGSSSPLADHLHKLDQLGADVYFITTGKRNTLPLLQRTEFNQLFSALHSMANAVNLRPEYSEILAATWMLLDLRGTDGSAASVIADHPEVISGIFQSK